MKRRFKILLALILCGALWPTRADAHVFVAPERALRNRVRHHDYNWQTIDILTVKKKKPDGTTYDDGGLRLFFYESERHVAEKAAGLMRQGYNYLADAFSFRPNERFSYILYNSYQEFLETNLYYLPEGVLGVTSPIDLTLTLPYFGDPELFMDVSTHELAHEFMIQKLRHLARQNELGPLDLMGVLPLWFIEGLAEYYAQHGLDPEALMVARDLIVNPDVERAHIYLGFFDERIQSVLWIYKMGQARCAFLEDEYGAGTIQRILEETPRLLDDTYVNAKDLTFKDLVEMVTGDNDRQVTAKFEQWIRKNAFRAYLESEQKDPMLTPVRYEGYLRTVTASPDGTMMLYRAIDTDTGQTKLWLADARVPEEHMEIAADGVPGLVSLHPVAGKNFALGNDKVAYAALYEKSDVIYLQSIKHESKRRRAPEGGKVWDKDPERGADNWAVDLEVGKAQRYSFNDVNLGQIGNMSFSPDGTELVFVGTTKVGVRDLYVLTLATKKLRKITTDRWAERDVTWGPNGIVYSSDATAGGHYNLFMVSPQGGKIERLTYEARDEESPLAFPDGRVMFTAYEEGRSDIYELNNGAIERRTNITTGLSDLAPGLDGGLMVAWYKSGEKRPAMLRREQLMASEPVASMETTGDMLSTVPTTPINDGPARELPMMSLDKATPYQPTSTKNWNMGTLFGFLGAGGGAIYGRILATANDELKDHALILDVEIYGRPELIDGEILYLNQGNRMTLGGGVFQQLEYRLDDSIPEVGLFTSGVRFFGGTGFLRHPLNTFQYIETGLKVGGAGQFLFRDTQRYLKNPNFNGTGENLLDDWQAQWTGINFQSEVALRFGHDTMRYHPLTGPYSGTSFLLTGTGTTQPFDGLNYANLRMDAARYFAVAGGANFFLRAGAGGTVGGGNFARQFYLSSFDTIRGVPFGTFEYLLGRNFYYTTAEFEFPLNTLVRVLFLPAIEGVLAMDFGAAANGAKGLWEKRVLNAVVGANFIFGGIMLRMHFAKPIGTGADPMSVGVPPLPTGWVTNLSLGLLYL